MDPISNADRLAILLRQKLLERSKAGRAGRSERREAAPPSGVRALANIEGMDERQLRRTFVQTILADQLGQSLINDPQFQQIVSRVTDTIEDDPDASRLLSRLVADLRAG
jgi:hypothetical protein